MGRCVDPIFRVRQRSGSDFAKSATTDSPARHQYAAIGISPDHRLHSVAGRGRSPGAMGPDHAGGAGNQNRRAHEN
jgi:hypothetical protein